MPIGPRISRPFGCVEEPVEPISTRWRQTQELSWEALAMSFSREPDHTTYCSMAIAPYEMHLTSSMIGMALEPINFGEPVILGAPTIFGVALNEPDEEGNLLVRVAGLVNGARAGRVLVAPRTRFPREIEEKAWELLRDYMTSEQYFAFMEGTSIEIVNQTNDYRLILNRSGEFVMLQGPRGAEIVIITGSKGNRIQSRDFPLGDEIATFIDWFRYKTDELIASWNCGVFSITKKGERR